MIHWKMFNTCKLTLHINIYVLCMYNIKLIQSPNANSLLFSVKKILNLKIFDGENGKRWSASVIDKQYEILCVSQFTLYHVIKGNKLDFHKAMPSGAAESLYIKFLTELKTKYRPEQIKGILTW